MSDTQKLIEEVCKLTEIEFTGFIEGIAPHVKRESYGGIIEKEFSEEIMGGRISELEDELSDCQSENRYTDGENMELERKIEILERELEKLKKPA